MTQDRTAELHASSEQIAAAAGRARSRFRKRRLANALRRRPVPDIPECSHASVIEVVASGEVVAGLCEICDAQLAAAWFTCQHQRAEKPYVDPEVLSWLDIGHSRRLALHQCPECRASWWAPITIADWINWL